MVLRVTALRSQQRAATVAYARAWTDLALRTDPVNVADWTVAVRDCYQYANLPWPRTVVTVASPLALARALFLGRVREVPGSETIERHAVERRMIGYEIGVEKLTFGSDCGADEIHEHVERFVQIFDQIGLSEDEKSRIWYHNAAEIFGLEPPSLAAE